MMQALRILGRYSTGPRGSERVDISTLLEDLLLFDEVVIDARNLEEFAELIRIFGVEDVLALMKTRCIGVSFDLLTVATSSNNPIPPEAGRRLSSGEFSVGLIGWPPEEQSIHLARTFSVMEQVAGGNGKAFRRLKGVISDSIEPIVSAEVRTSLRDDVLRDLSSRSELISAAIASEVERILPGSTTSRFPAVRIERVDGSVLRVVEHDLTQFGFGPERVVAVVESAARSIGEQSRKFALMQAVKAVPTFCDSDRQLFDAKTLLILDGISPMNRRERLHRVLEAIKLPAIAAIVDARQLSLKKLIEVRESPECREFRNWLAKGDDLDEREIERLFTSIRARFSAASSSWVARALRWASTKGLPVMISPDGMATKAVGAALSGLDKLVFERLLKSPGHVAFVTNRYPSLYETSIF